MFHTKDAGAIVLLMAVAASSPCQVRPAGGTPTTVVASSTAAPSLSPAEVREAQLAADTQRLYQLAQELKVELDKTTKDTLSLTVVKKAAEIEKLAHSISAQMKSR